MHRILSFGKKKWKSALVVLAAIAAASIAPAQSPSGAAAAPKAPASASAALATAAASPETSELSPEIQAKYKSAVEQFSQQDVAGALETLRQMAAADVRLVPPRLILAQWYSQTKNQNAVRVSLEMATEESPTDPEAFLLLGEIALRRGELTAAELLFQKADGLLAAYQANPERQKKLSLALLKNRIALVRNRGRWAQMQELLGTLLKTEGETPENCRLIGVSFFELDKEDSAKSWFTRADQLAEGKGIPADGMIAQLYLNKGKTEQAKESLKNALAANPQSVEVMNLYLAFALGENDMETFGKIAEQLYAADPKAPGVLRTCGIAALYQGDFPKAEKMFQEALALEPANTEITNGLALALCEQNDPEKTKLALQYAASNLQKQGNNRDFLSTFGWALSKSGDKEKALKVLQQSAADGQINSAAAYYLAVLLSDKGEKDTAKKLLGAALANKTPFFKRKAAQELLQRLNQQ